MRAPGARPGPPGARPPRRSRHDDQVVSLERAATAARRRHVARLLAVAVALAVAAAGIGWLLLASSVLGVQSVRVVGESRLSDDQVIRAAGIDRGAPLARVDTGEVARRVGALAPVRDVEVRRAWPRTVEIRLRERTPAAVAPRGSAWALVDRTGVEFATVSTRPSGLPIVSAPVDQGSAALRATLDVLEALPADVRRQVRQVRASSPESLTLRLSRGREVEWGSPDRSARKAAVLAVLLSRRASVYDVSAPDTPTTRR